MQLHGNQHTRIQEEGSLYLLYNPTCSDEISRQNDMLYRTFQRSWHVRASFTANTHECSPLWHFAQVRGRGTPLAIWLLRTRGITCLRGIWVSTLPIQVSGWSSNRMSGGGGLGSLALHPPKTCGGGGLGRDTRSDQLFQKIV